MLLKRIVGIARADGSTGHQFRQGCAGDGPVGGRRSGRSISSEHAEGRSIEGYADRSKAEGFVDARRLQSEDLVSKTLQETTGTIGIMTRPKVVDFGERLKERRQAGARAIVLRVLIGLVVAVVLGAVVWLFLFSSVFRLEPGNISVVGATNG